MGGKLETRLQPVTCKAFFIDFTNSSSLESQPAKDGGTVREINVDRMLGLSA